MTDPMELVGLVEGRIGQDFDGECHLTEEEARQIAACIREMVEWRDIETAPHETLVVLGWFEEGVWKQDLGLASAGQRWPTGSSNMWWHGSATHWIPLPPAPGAEA